MRNIVFRGKDSSVAIMTLAPGADRKETVQKFLDAHQGVYVDHFDYDGEFPSDRELRDAWTISGNKIVVDDAKAHNIRMNKLRQERNKKLEELDKEQLRYLGDAVKLAEIEEQKQLLRDSLNHVNLAEK